MEIRLFKVLGTDTLRHRDTAKIILNLISKAPISEGIAIDFSGIDFASHPFCHELRRGLADRDATYLNMEPVESMMRNAFKKPKIGLKPHPESKKLRPSSDDAPYNRPEFDTPRRRPSAARRRQRHQKKSPNPKTSPKNRKRGGDDEVNEKAHARAHPRMNHYAKQIAHNL